MTTIEQDIESTALRVEKAKTIRKRAAQDGVELLRKVQAAREGSTTEWIFDLDTDHLTAHGRKANILRIHGAGVTIALHIVDSYYHFSDHHDVEWTITSDERVGSYRKREEMLEALPSFTDWNVLEEVVEIDALTGILDRLSSITYDRATLKAWRSSKQDYKGGWNPQWDEQSGATALVFNQFFLPESTLDKDQHEAVKRVIKAKTIRWDPFDLVFPVYLVFAFGVSLVNLAGAPALAFLILVLVFLGLAVWPVKRIVASTKKARQVAEDFEKYILPLPPRAKS